jgi:hypothetical protein
MRTRQAPCGRQHRGAAAQSEIDITGNESGAVDVWPRHYQLNVQILVLEKTPLRRKLDRQVKDSGTLIGDGYGFRRREGSDFERGAEDRPDA